MEGTMSQEQPSPAEVMRILQEVDSELEELSDSITGIARSTAQSKHDYELAKAKALITAKMTNPKGAGPIIEAQATVASSDEYLEYLTSQAVLDASKKRIDIVGTRVTAFQTVMKTIREGGG
jgi:hypothetical protein